MTTLFRRIVSLLALFLLAKTEALGWRRIATIHLFQDKPYAGALIYSRSKIYLARQWNGIQNMERTEFRVYKHDRYHVTHNRPVYLFIFRYGRHNRFYQMSVDLRSGKQRRVTYSSNRNGKSTKEWIRGESSAFFQLKTSRHRGCRQHPWGGRRESLCPLFLIPVLKNKLATYYITSMGPKAGVLDYRRPQMTNRKNASAYWYLLSRAKGQLNDDKDHYFMQNYGTGHLVGLTYRRGSGMTFGAGPVIKRGRSGLDEDGKFFTFENRQGGRGRIAFWWNNSWRYLDTREKVATFQSYKSPSMHLLRSSGYRYVFLDYERARWYRSSSYLRILSKSSDKVDTREPLRDNNNQFVMMRIHRNVKKILQVTDTVV